MAGISANDALGEGLSRLAATGPEYAQSLSTLDNSNKREAPRRQRDRVSRAAGPRPGNAKSPPPFGMNIMNIPERVRAPRRP